MVRPPQPIVKHEQGATYIVQGHVGVVIARHNGLAASKSATVNSTPHSRPGRSNAPRSDAGVVSRLLHSTMLDPDPSAS